MVLHLVGLGLCDAADISLKGLRVLKRCQAVHLEAYTSILAVDAAHLEQEWDVKITVADRAFIESGIDATLEAARAADVAILVVGDPFGATTHCDLLLRARELGVPTNVVHNASVMNAIGACGLSLYRYGETVSIPFFSPGWRPASFYDKLVANRARGLHTLALVDIKVKEPTMQSLARGRPEYLPPRFMTVRQAVLQLLEVAESRDAAAEPGQLSRESRAIGVARLGASDQLQVAGTLAELAVVDFGPPLHSLVLLGEMSEVEEDLVAGFCVAAKDAPQLEPARIAALDEETERNAEAHEGFGRAFGGWVQPGDSDDDVESALEPPSPPPPPSSGSECPVAAPAAPNQRGGLHKFDAAEVDVNGGDATAEDFLEAFGI